MEIDDSANTENEWERQVLQAKATISNNVLLALKKKTPRASAGILGPVAAAELLRHVAEQIPMSGVFTVPVEAVEKANLDMATWERAVKAQVLSKTKLNGVPAFVITTEQRVDGVGIIKHPFLDRLRYVAAQDPDEWQKRVQDTIESNNSRNRGMN